MDNTYIAYNGPSENLLLILGGTTNDSKELEKKLNTEGISTKFFENILDENIFIFQQAFSLIDNKIKLHSISKAKEIWLDHYRSHRKPLLEKLDLEYMRADEQGNLELKKEITQKKQALRDVTKTELPNTLEGIKNTWPEILGPNPFQ